MRNGMVKSLIEISREDNLGDESADKLYMYKGSKIRVNFNDEEKSIEDRLANYLVTIKNK